MGNIKAVEAIALNHNTDWNERIAARRSHTVLLGRPRLPNGWMWMRGSKLRELMLKAGTGIELHQASDESWVAYSDTLTWVMRTPSDVILVSAYPWSDDVVTVAGIVKGED